MQLAVHLNFRFLWAAVAEVSQGNNKIYVAFQSILSQIFYKLTNYYYIKDVSF